MIGLVTGTRTPGFQRLLKRGQGDTPREEAAVRGIVGDVARRGDKALFAFTRRFDKVTLTRGNLRIHASEVRAQARRCPSALRRSIDAAIQNIRRFHLQQLPKGYTVRQSGLTLRQQVQPLESVGLYIPGGKSPLFSTILMTAIPAQIAGVKRIAVATPPSKAGLHPAMAYAFLKLRLTEIYRVGGAQAIAALALGTPSIPRVDKIAGPGNIYVSLAKKLLVGRVGIDMIAGPTEVVVVADEGANPAWIATDLLAQAEHGTGYESVVLLTTSRTLALRVQALAGNKIAAHQGLIVVLKKLDACLAAANRLAPEHLELAVKNPEAALKKVRHAGAVFLGYYACESLGDYIAGPNHVLPTHGSARFQSPLGVYDFVKRTSVIAGGLEGLRRVGKQVIEMAGAEGLPYHGESARIRLSK